MTIAVVYVYPMVKTRIYFPLAKRFAETWKQFPPSISHTLYVVCNGGSPGVNDKAPFDGIPATFYTHNNVGWDIGAFQYAADGIPCELLVCLGAHCHFHRAGWLERMAQSYVENGPNLYGTRGYYYGGHHHIRTTCFWMPPQLFQAYPYTVGNSRISRYQFEHGENNMSEWTEKAGFQCLVATWDRIWPVADWNDGFGLDQGSPNRTALVFDQWTTERHDRLDRFA